MTIKKIFAKSLIVAVILMTNLMGNTFQVEAYNRPDTNLYAQIYARVHRVAGNWTLSCGVEPEEKERINSAGFGDIATDDVRRQSDDGVRLTREFYVSKTSQQWGYGSRYVRVVMDRSTDTFTISEHRVPQMGLGDAALQSATYKFGVYKTMSVWMQYGGDPAVLSPYIGEKGGVKTSDGGTVEIDTPLELPTIEKQHANGNLTKTEVRMKSTDAPVAINRDTYTTTYGKLSWDILPLSANRIRYSDTLVIGELGAYEEALKFTDADGESTMVRLNQNVRDPEYRHLSKIKYAASGVDYDPNNSVNGGVDGWTKKDLILEIAPPKKSTKVSVNGTVFDWDSSNGTYGKMAITDEGETTQNTTLISCWNSEVLSGNKQTTAKIDKTNPAAAATWVGDGKVTNESTDATSGIQVNKTAVYFQRAGGTKPAGNEQGWQTISDPGAQASTLNLPTSVGNYDLYVKTMDNAANTAVELATNGKDITIPKVEFYGVDTKTTIKDLTAIILINQKINRPVNPQEEGYTFNNWYKEPECKNLWDFNQPVRETDLTNGVFKLYSQWSQGNISGFVSIPSYLQLKEKGSGTENKLGVTETIGLEVPEQGSNIGLNQKTITVGSSMDQTKLKLVSGAGDQGEHVIQILNADGTSYVANEALATLKQGGTTSSEFKMESIETTSAFTGEGLYNGTVTFTINTID